MKGLDKGEKKKSSCLQESEVAPMQSLMLRPYSLGLVGASVLGVYLNLNVAYEQVCVVGTHSCTLPRPGGKTRL